jgi:hypothetical protein
VKLPGKRVFGVVAVMAITVSIGAFLHSPPVEANGPPSGQEATFPFVAGVNGSMGSIAQMEGLSGGFIPQSFMMSGAPLNNVMVSATPTIAGTEIMTSGGAFMTNMNLGSALVGRFYGQVSGRYCKDKTNGDVFIADGAPIEPGLAC